MIRHAIHCAGGLALAICASAHAEDTAGFYRGKTVTIAIASAPGGGFDAYGRLVARHIGAHIPGAPNVIAQNVPGAAGATATFYVVNVASKDGTVIGAIHPGNIIEPVLGDKRKVRYDPGAFQYIGNANSDVYVCVTRTDAPAKTFEEALTKELIMGSGGEAASTRDFPVMLANVLGAKFKMVLGYSGNREVQLAIEKGEIHGECGASWSSVLSEHPDWFKNNLARVLVQEASVGHPDLDRMGVPKTVDFARMPEQRAVLDLVYSQERFGRPYIMAPETPADRVAVMRRAFADTFRDPAFLADARRMNLANLGRGGASAGAESVFHAAGHRREGEAGDGACQITLALTSPEISPASTAWAGAPAPWSRRRRNAWLPRTICVAPAGPRAARYWDRRGPSARDRFPDPSSGNGC